MCWSTEPNITSGVRSHSLTPKEFSPFGSPKAPRPAAKPPLRWDDVSSLILSVPPVFCLSHLHQADIGQLTDFAPKAICISEGD